MLTLFYYWIELKNKTLNFLEINIEVEKKQQEIIIALLSNIGYDGFLEEKQYLKAYIEDQLYNKASLEQILNSHQVTNFSTTTLENQNWNKKWEENFDTILIDEKIQIRAPFHTSLNFPFEIIIEPKMSFGTGHHATTEQVSSKMLSFDFNHKNVIDLGAGTGILSILAKLLGSNNITAIDFDEWSIDNMKENFEKNHCDFIEIKQGDLSDVNVVNKLYSTYNEVHVTLANLNRNLLLKIIPTISKLLKSKNILITSGYIKSDEQLIITQAIEQGFELLSRSEKNNWMVNTFVKK